MQGARAIRARTSTKVEHSMLLEGKLRVSAEGKFFGCELTLIRHNGHHVRIYSDAASYEGARRHECLCHED